MGGVWGEEKERPRQSASLGVADRFLGPTRLVLGGACSLGAVLSALARIHATLLGLGLGSTQGVVWCSVV